MYTVPPLITFRRKARSRPMRARPPPAGLCVDYNTARSRPPIPLPSPRAPLRSLLPLAACRFAPAPPCAVLFDCGGPRRACGAGRPRRPLALARPAPRRAGKFFPPLPARLCAAGGFAARFLPLASLGRRASACPPDSRRPPCRLAQLYALASRRKSIRAARPLLRLSAPRVLGDYGGVGGGLRVFFLFLS